MLDHVVVEQHLDAPDSGRNLMPRTSERRIIEPSPAQMCLGEALAAPAARVGNVVRVLRAVLPER